MSNGYDTLIRNATVVDGTGAPRFKADIVLRGGRIAEVSRTPVAEAGESIDVQGAIVCPGFIDVHSHADISPLLSEDDTTKLLQGVTTEVVGNCGSTVAPIGEGHEDALVSTIGKSHILEEYPWRTFAEYLAHLDRHGYVTNMCPLVGHGAIRAAVMGIRDNLATDAEIDAMVAHLDEALDAGAFGFSCGLIYPPGVYSDARELVELAKRLDNVHTLACHMRNEADYLEEAIDEICSVAASARARLQISHLKASGRGNWGLPERPLQQIRGYADAGLDVNIDVYPYMAASTKLSACLPPWANAGGASDTLARLQDPSIRARIREELESPAAQGWDSPYHNAGASGIVIATSLTHRHDGRDLATLAAEQEQHPIEVLFSVLFEEKLSVTMLEFSMSEGDMLAFLTSDLAMVGSDGMSVSQRGKPHPRLTGTYPRILGHYVRERSTISLESALHKMTALPARKFRVPDRGRIEPGRIADLVCFDVDQIGTGSSYEDPWAEPVGINWVMQEGVIVVDHGAWLGRRSGRRLTPGA